VIQRYVQQHHYSQAHIRVKPNRRYRVKGLSAIVNNLEPAGVPDKKVPRLIPSLLNTYLAIGAMICGEPAYDREFRCMDYLTILDVETMNQGYVDKVFGAC
jgi:putative hemolysin